MDRRNRLDQPIGAGLAHWKPPLAPAAASLEGRYCVLERLDPVRHAASLFDAYVAAGDAGDWTYLPYGPFPRRAGFDAWIATSCGAEDPLFYALIEARSGRALGMASYLRYTPLAGSIEVGHINFSRALQRSAAATEAMYLMMRQVFTDPGFRRYEWKCDALNLRSRRAAQRLGFSFEGVFRQATVYKQRNRDTAWYSIIDREWPAIDRALQRWLAEDNFDAAGRQRQSLVALMPRPTKTPN